MGAEARYLAMDERVVCMVRRHPAIMFRPFFEAVGVVIAAMFIGVLFSPSEGGDVVDTLLGLISLGFVLRLLWRIWEWSVDRLVVTDRRLFEVSGLLTRRVSSMPLAKVTDMAYHRSVMGRLLGYGELRVESPGQKQALAKISHLPKPDDFYRTVTSLVMAPSHVQREEVAKGIDEEDTGPLPRVIV